MDIQVIEKMPGAKEAASINRRLKGVGIYDVTLFHDSNIQPYGMWAVVQIKGETNNLVMPESYESTSLEPYLLWWCKNELDGKFRIPNEEDFRNIIRMVRHAQSVWDKGERRADEFDELDVEKDRKHKEKFHDKIHSIAPELQKAIRKEL